MNDFKLSKKAVVSLSGGLDSTTLLYLAVKELGAENVFAVSFDYNQRHDVELIVAKNTCKKLGVKHEIIDVKFMGEFAKNVSAMVKGSVETPDMEDILGDPQPVTYMPNRNMILLSIVCGYAESVGADTVSLGIQATDSYSYWDTTPDFYDSIHNVLKLNRKNQIMFVAPFVNMTKIDEIKLGVDLGVDYENSWSCYQPNESPYEAKVVNEDRIIHLREYRPCGKCPSCSERRNAFNKLGMVDPLVNVIE